MTHKTKPRHKDRLSVKKIARLRKPGKYIDGGGLSLLVSDIGSKSWSFRFERNKIDRAYVLGPLHGDGGATTIPRSERRGLTLDEARAEAANAVELLRQGRDPIEARKDTRDANNAATAAKAAEAASQKTFEVCANEFYDSYNQQWSNEDYRKKFLSSLKMYAFPKIGALPVSAIDTPLVLSVIHSDLVAMQDLHTRMQQLGSSFPTYQQFKVLGLSCLKTALMNTPIWAREFDHLPPNQRRSFKELIGGWAATIESGIVTRLGEAKQKQVA
jgi:hypothetical protein